MFYLNSKEIRFRFNLEFQFSFWKDITYMKIRNCFVNCTNISWQVSSTSHERFPGHASIRKTLVEHRTKIARAKKPLVASSFLQGTCCPVSGYLGIIARFILPYFHLFARSSGNYSTYKSFIFQKKKRKSPKIV